MVRTAFRWIAAIAFVLAGVNHFIVPAHYRRIVPPSFPKPDVLVTVSGVAEIVGGVGLLIPPLRRPAGWGLIALLLAVFPANLYMASATDPQVTFGLPRWALRARLPMQGLMIAWVWWVSRRPRR